MNSTPDFLHQPYWYTMGPMMVVAATAFVVMILEFIFRSGNRRWLSGISMLGILVALGVAIRFDVAQVHQAAWIKPQLLLNTIAVDSLGTVFSILILIGSFLVLLFTFDYTGRTKVAAEHTYLILFAVVGALTMATAFDLITLYVGLELLSVSSYVLTALKKKSLKSVEGGAKYLVMGSIGSATLLYGFSFIYGISGTTNLAAIASSAQDLWATYPTMVIVAFVLVVAGLGVKLSFVPFHMWTPDAYEGAPSPISAFLATVSKVAGFAMLFRILVWVFGSGSSAEFYWIAIIAAITMVVGNLLALPQKNMKRLLAFSSVAQAGYVVVPFALFGFITASQDWYGTIDSVMFYLLAYTFMTTGAFAVAHLVERDRESGESDALIGLARRNPWLATALTIFLLSLAGMPLTGGFVGKFYIFTETVHLREVWLGIVLFGTSVMSFFYYFGWIRKMFIRDPSDNPVSPKPIQVAPAMHTLLGLCVLGTLVLGVVPAAFLHSLGQTPW